MTEFWPELLTTASWQKLRELKKELKGFVVIGGWAIYLWTGMHKSKDIDIIVDFKALERLKERYDLNKNPHLKKYEIKLDKFDVDIYVPHFSRFVLPIGELMKNTEVVQGFTTLKPEALLVLKQAAEIDRKGSIKGEKDAIDILTLLIKAPFSKARYFKLLKENNLPRYADELARVFKDYDARNAAAHLGLAFKDFQAWRKAMLKALARREA